MRRLGYILLGFALSASTAYAGPLQCFGVTPVWKLNLTDETAEFTFRGETKSFDIPLFTVAKGLEAPIAYSLIGEFDTAIVIVNEFQCAGDQSKSVYVLTQANTAAILLSGCCFAAE